MGHLSKKYNSDYFLGGRDHATGREYGVLGHAEFKEERVHERHVMEFDFLVSFAGGLKDKDVLDIGFGRGDHVPLILREGAKSYHGIDFSSASLSIAEKHVQDPRVRFELLDARDLDETVQYDVISMFDVIEHIPVFEMEVVWRKIRKILRPGGVVVLSTPIFKFNNPNASDHSDLTHAEMGLHCHKQTIGTIARTSIVHGFVIGQSNDRCIGLMRRVDLSSLPEDRRNIFLNNHRKILADCGLPPEKEAFSDDEIRSLVPGAGRVLIGCVAENNPKYLAQALRLVQSLRWFGGKMAGTNIVVCIVEGADSAYVEEFEKWGAFVRIVPRFSYFHPQSNKLRFLDLPEVLAYDTVILMDCDTLIVQDPSDYINGKTFQAKMADKATVPLQTFRDLFLHFGLPQQEPRYRCTYSGEPTVWYCNSGVLVFPQGFLRSLYPVWRRYTLDLAANSHLLGKSYNFCDQASLALAFAENPLPFEELPVAMNFPLHITKPESPANMTECDPVIIHYHRLTDPSGHIKDTVYVNAQKRISDFNEQLTKSRTTRFNNRLFWDTRYAENPELGSGRGSREAALELKRGIIKQLLDSARPESVLDVGCGDQFVSADIPDEIYTGLDISPVIIAQNSKKYPGRRYINGNFLEIDIPSFDLTICFDVVIHLNDREAYQAFVGRLVRCTRSQGIISGYEKIPDLSSDITFFHEPLSETLRKSGAQKLRRLGSYRDTDIWLYSCPDENSRCTGDSNIVEELRQQIRERDNELARLRAIENSVSWKTLRKGLDIFDTIDRAVGRPANRARAVLGRQEASGGSNLSACRDKSETVNKLIFVHQGKAGGSTLVNALRQSYGAENLYNDTDQNARWAKGRVARFMDEKLENWRIYSDRVQYRVIHGHFSPRKYRKTFPDAIYMTLFRNPIQQLASLYYYWQRPLSFGNLPPEQRILLEQKLSLPDFIELFVKSKRHRRYVSLHQLENFDFVGITEAFESSMALLKKKFLPDFSFEAEPCNTNPMKEINESYRLDSETMTCLRHLLAPRLRLYEEAVERFRNECRQENIDCKL